MRGRTAQSSVRPNGVLDMARESLLALDAQGSIVEANAAAVALLGHDLLGEPLAAFVRLDDRRRFHQTLGGLEPGEPVSVEVRLLHDEQPVEVALCAVARSNAPPIAAAIRLDGERQQRLRLERLMSRVPYAAIAIDDNLEVVLANPRAEALLGEAIHAGMLFDAAAPAELRALARRLVHVPAPLRPLELTVSDGRVLRVSGLAADLDDPALIFLEDVSVNGREEHVMREFLRNAAHQLRTPLAGITAAVEILQSGAKNRPDDRDRFLAHVERHAHRLTRLARGLLVLARSQVGEDVPIDFVELQPLVERLVAEAEPREGVDVHIDCEPGIASLASPELLHEALAALLENAVDHTDAGEIRISAARLNSQVLLTVADTGPGIRPEFVDRVFEPFFRLSPSGDGYGLGLAIAAQAVQAMGGEIGVSSTFGSGTSFTVSLPSATLVE